MNEDNNQESLIKHEHDPLIRVLNHAVVVSVKILAILMVVIIWVALIDVIVNLGLQILKPPSLWFSIENLITLLGDFLAVLIAIEIFMNIVFYLKKDAIHVPLVLSTALTAVARKVIILDYKVSDPHNIYATAAVIISVGLVYWLITKKN